jgi:hypothetical protein
VLEIGMKKEAVLGMLGQPIKISVDTNRNEEWLDFNKNGIITILITRYNNRVNQIILTAPGYVLANRICIGLNITNVLDVNTDTKAIGSFYHWNLPNFFRQETWYELSITIDTDYRGIIRRIQLNGPSEP